MSEEKEYLDNIIGKHKESYVNVFEEVWGNHIQTFPKKYRSGEQLLIGSRFRPVLVCWGYVLSGREINDTKKVEISHLALYLELIHKATLLIDDVLDDDAYRRGKPSFHTQYSENEAILFGLYLFGDALDRLVKFLKNSEVSDISFEIMNILSETIKQMSIGALTEMNLEGNYLTSISLIQKIIEQQTVSIIKNGLLTGFKYGNGDDSTYNTVNNIGHDCGYIFQVLNDLEPFGSLDLNTEYKGRNNIDILRSRKNIVAAFLFNSLSKKEKDNFDRLLIDNEIPESEILDIIHSLYKKHNILDVIISNLSDVKNNVSSNMKVLKSQVDNNKLALDFQSFINYIMGEAIKKVGEQHQEKLSEILII